MEEILLLRSSSNSRNERAPRTEPLGTVAVSVSESGTTALPSLVHEREQDPLQDLNIGQVKQYSMDRTPVNSMNIGKNETVFHMDMGEEERFGMPIPKSMVMFNELNKIHNKSKHLTKKTVAIAAMTYEKEYMEHMRQYQGLLIYNN